MWDLLSSGLHMVRLAFFRVFLMVRYLAFRLAAITGSNPWGTGGKFVFERRPKHSEVGQCPTRIRVNWYLMARCSGGKTCPLGKKCSLGQPTKKQIQDALQSLIYDVSPGCSCPMKGHALAKGPTWFARSQYFGNPRKPGSAACRSSWLLAVSFRTDCFMTPECDSRCVIVASEAKLFKWGSGFEKGFEELLSCECLEPMPHPDDVH